MLFIFISYSRKDIDFASKLAKDLESARHNVWQDLSDIRSGDDWLASIDRALKRCDVLILILSPDSLASSYVRDEVNRARNLRKRIIPVLWRPIDDLPFYLASIQQIDFRGNYSWSLARLLSELNVRQAPSNENAPGPIPPPLYNNRLRKLGIAFFILGIVAIAIYASPLRSRLLGLGGVPTEVATHAAITFPEPSTTAGATATVPPPSPTVTDPPPTVNATATKAAQQTEVTIAVEKTQTAQPTHTLLPSPTKIDTPLPTNTPPPPTFTLTPAPDPCTIQVANEIAALWKRDQLGCPLAEPQIVWASWTPYQTGQMLWRDDNKQIYGFFNSGWWQSVADTWDGQSETPSRGEAPPGLSAPVRGTGHIWGTNDTFYQELGWPIDEQRGFCALVQNFENGLILRSSQVAACKDNLFNQATTANFRLDWLRIFANGSWQSKLR